MQIRTTLMLLALGLAGLTGSTQGADTPPAPKPTAVFEMKVRGDIEIDTEGHVRSQQLKGEFSPAVAQLIENNVRSWHFEPIQVDGRPVIARTRVSLLLEATPLEGGSYRLKVLNLIFGAPESLYALAPPRYPEQAGRAGLGAKVIMLLKLDADGNVVDTHAIQTSLSATGNERFARKWRLQFEKASAMAARRWKFNPAEKINGTNIDSTVRVPIVFSMGSYRGEDTSADWRAFFPGPINPSSWLGIDPRSEMSNLAELKEGEAQPLASRFKPTESIIGTVF